jgi:microcystin degradation protein MlrC
MADTGRAAAEHLALLLRAKKPLAKAFRQLPFLIPISWQCTNDQPTKGIYEKLATLQSEAVPTLSFAPGFPAADFVHCGPSVFAYGLTQADADAAADDWAARDDFEESPAGSHSHPPAAAAAAVEAPEEAPLAPPAEGISGPCSDFLLRRCVVAGSQRWI